MEERRDLMQMMLDLLDERERRPRLPSRTPAPPASTVSADGNTSVKALEVGYFYPNMPREWGENDVVDRDGMVYYCNIYTFTNRIRVAAQTRDTTFRETVDEPSQDTSLEQFAGILLWKQNNWFD